jgi:ABC-type spermidine/putrescine transport system permease subunit II
MAVVLLPMFVPGIVLALAFYIYFALLGLQGSELALILAHAVLIIPYVVIVMGAALRDVDPALERAARTMGASHFYTFIHVTLPLVRNGIGAAAIFGFLLSFDELVVAQFLADIDTRTLPVKMYESIRYETSPVLAAISTLMTVVAFGLSALTTRRYARPINPSPQAAA